jgi:PKD repeat protein
VTPRYSPWLLIITLCVADACGGDDLVLPGDGEMAIRVVDGDGQRGSVGELLAAPVVVEVIDSKGDPVQGATVAFVLTSAGDGAEISPASVRTDGDGHAEAHVLLGDKVGLQTGQATVTGNGTPLSSATFSALAAEASSPPESPPPESPPPPSSDNKRPQADFGVNCHDLRCSFNDQSKDDDGSIVTREWDFGDGSSSSERNPSHSYQHAGTVQVTLTVTDNGGATDSRTRTADPSAPPSPPSPPDPPPPPPAQNKPPRAEFEYVCQDLRCTVVDRSTDEDGDVVRWEWDFGDGSTSSERNPSHTYATAGKYDVLLVVTDDDGAADSKSHRVEPKSPPREPPAPPPPPPDPPPPPANKAPHADFHADCRDESACEFEDTSTDDDGNIVSWSWSFGDGGTSSERNPTHTFSTDGRFDVSLTVTDDDGASNTKTHEIRVKKD